MKFSYIIIFVIIIILALAGYLIFLRPKTGNSGGRAVSSGGTQQLGNIIPLNPASIPAGDTITFGTANGSVSVNNFYKIAKGYDGQALVIRQVADYEIVYDPLDSVFGILVTAGTPVASVRDAAQADLVSILGIPQSQVCSLNVVWSVSINLNKALSGINYPLSFCPAKTPGVQ